MNDFELMLRSGVMSECRPLHRWEERRMVNQALKEIMPPDRTWHVAILSAVIILMNAVLFVKWWMI